MCDLQFTILMMITWIILGVLYAIHVATVVIDAEWTWFRVVIGDAVTDLGMAITLYYFTGSFFLSSIPFLFHICTGLPMIAGERIKHKHLKNEAENYRVMFSHHEKK